MYYKNIKINRITKSLIKVDPAVYYISDTQSKDIFEETMIVFDRTTLTCKCGSSKFYIEINGNECKCKCCKCEKKMNLI